MRSLWKHYLLRGIPNLAVHSKMNVYFMIALLNIGVGIHVAPTAKKNTAQYAKIIYPTSDLVLNASIKELFAKNVTYPECLGKGFMYAITAKLSMKFEVL